MAANDPGQPPLSIAPDGSDWSSDLPTPASALAIGAHPDDVEFGCGATLAKWAAAGCHVHHLVLTDGSKGTWNADADTAALAATRQTEQRLAAAELRSGAPGDVHFLGRVDGDLAADRVTISDVARIIRQVRPQVVLGHDPWKRYRLHPDHRAAGLVTCDAIVAARDPHFFREHGIAHHRPEALLLWEADEPNHTESVSSTVETKIRALLAHTSQFESTMGGATRGELDAFAKRIRRRLEDLGRPHGLASAEIFHLMTDL